MSENTKWHDLEQSFQKIGAEEIFHHTILGNKEKRKELSQKYDGNEQQLKALIREVKRQNHGEQEKVDWNQILRQFEDGNTEKAEVRNNISEKLIEKFNFKTPKDTEQLWVFKNPVYEPEGEQFIREKINEKIGKYATAHDVNEIIEKVESRSYCRRQEEKPPAKFVPVKNGWYNLKTGDLEEPRPQYFAVNHVPVKYDPEADCTRIKEFLGEIVDESDVPLLQELIGFSLYRDYPFARAFMLLGSGSNGKSTFLNLIKEFIGRDNVANPSLQKLGEDRFASAQLYGKLANIHADLSSKKLESTGTFKMLTGGDLIHGERKFQDPFQFENYAKLIYSANELPATTDTTDAFFRRWIVIRFPYKFTSKEGDGNKDKNPDILEDIMSDEELSGLFNWAVEGLQRVLSQEGFSDTHGRESVKDEWLLRTQPMQVFFQKAVEEEAGVSVGKDELYQDYDAFCQSVSVVSKDRSVFFKKLYSQFPQVSEEKKRDSDSRERRLYGITTREIEQVVQAVQGKSGSLRVHPRTDTQEVGFTPDHPDHHDLHKKIKEFVEDHDEGDGVRKSDIISHVDADEEAVEEAFEVLIQDGTLYEPQEGGVKKL